MSDRSRPCRGSTGRLLTPRMALDHQTGFPNWRRETGGKLAFIREPGTAFGYSREGYEYVARLAEKRRPAVREAGPNTSLRSSRYDAHRLHRAPMDQRPHRNARRPGQKVDGAADCDVVRRSRLGITTPAQYASFIESLMNGVGEPGSIRKLRESVLTDRKAQLCVGKLAASCPEQVGLGVCI